MWHSSNCSWFIHTSHDCDSFQHQQYFGFLLYLPSAPCQACLPSPQLPREQTWETSEAGKSYKTSYSITSSNLSRRHAAPTASRSANTCTVLLNCSHYAFYTTDAFVQSNLQFVHLTSTGARVRCHRVHAHVLNSNHIEMDTSHMRRSNINTIRACLISLALSLCLSFSLSRTRTL